MTQKINVVTIDTSVPQPADDGRGGKLLWPVDQLEIGESFVFPLEKRSSVASMASHIRKASGKKFTVRKQDETTARIWRTA